MKNYSAISVLNIVNFIVKKINNITSKNRYFEFKNFKSC